MPGGAEEVRKSGETAGCKMARANFFACAGVLCDTLHPTARSGCHVIVGVPKSFLIQLWFSFFFGHHFWWKRYDRALAKREL
jgi:hypothetical protein